MQKRLALLIPAAMTLALPQLAFAHGQSSVPTQDSAAFARWESMGSAGPEPIQTIDGKRIPGAPNGMVAEMESPRNQAMRSSMNTSAVNSAPTRNGTSEINNAEQTGKNLPQEIQAKLKEDGFTNVKVVPGSFIVSAKDKRGEPVTMMIGPNSMMMVTQVTDGNSPSTNNQK
jgi:hypothetical protein